MRRQMGEVVIDHRASPGLPEDVARAAGYDPALCREGKVYRQESLTCRHCRGVVVKNPFRTRDRASCAKCGGDMRLVSVILDDRELDRILAHQGWPIEFPKTKASRAPPGRVERGGEASQVDPRAEKWDGKDETRSDEPA